MTGRSGCDASRRDTCRPPRRATRMARGPARRLARSPGACPRCALARAQDRRMPAPCCSRPCAGNASVSGSVRAPRSPQPRRRGVGQADDRQPVGRVVLAADEQRFHHDDKRGVEPGARTAAATIGRQARACASEHGFGYFRRRIADTFLKLPISLLQLRVGIALPLISSPINLTPRAPDGPRRFHVERSSTRFTS